MKPSPTVVAAALLALLVLSSCGDDAKDARSDTSTGADPEAVVHRYFAGLARGDGRIVCGLMTLAGREGLRQLPEGERAGLVRARGRRARP